MSYLPPARAPAFGLTPSARPVFAPVAARAGNFLSAALSVTPWRQRCAWDDCLAPRDPRAGSLSR
jgi:hypothetical protein